jgi:hypothetical protein
MKNILFIAIVLTAAVCAFGATKRIARVNEDGDILFDRDAGFSPDVIEVEVSEVDGSIYVSMYQFNIGKFNENGYYDAGFDLTLFAQTRDFDVSNHGYLWITGDEISSDEGLYKYTDNGDYVDGAEDFDPNSSSYDDSLNEVWAADDDFQGSGVHKFDEYLSRLLNKTGYQAQYINCDSLSGNLWFGDIRPGHYEVVSLNSSGDERLSRYITEGPKDFQASPVDGGCWFISGGGLIKVDTYGSIIFRDSSFNEIAAIDVNESDGSVWVASNIPKRLVHLDKDGNRQLYKEWPGGDFAHLAVDQRNGTCIVIYEEYRSGAEMNIQPASVGEIKAMYAE